MDEAGPVAPLAVTVLGSGTCTPSLTRQPAGYLLTRSSTRILVDSGSGTIGRLMQRGVPVHDLDGLIYTHLHLDHTGDLFPLLFSLRNSYGYTRTRPLPIYGPPGFRAFFDPLMAVYGRWVVSPEFALDVHELGPDEHRTLDCGLRLETVPMVHTPSSLGYRFVTPEGTIVALTGDADEGPRLVDLLRNADLAVVDCSAPDDLRMPGHLTPRVIGQAATRGQTRALLLSHFYPPADTPDIVQQVRRFYGGVILRAEDGCQYPVLSVAPQAHQL